MQVSVTYWEHDQVVVRDGARWSELPVGGVMWVWVRVGGHGHRLLGADGYWVHGQHYGCTYEDAAPIYGGMPNAAWEVADGRMRSLGAVPPPEGAHVIRGVEVPDEVWADLMGRER